MCANKPSRGDDTSDSRVRTTETGKIHVEEQTLDFVEALELVDEILEEVR